MKYFAANCGNPIGIGILPIISVIESKSIILLLLLLFIYNIKNIKKNISDIKDYTKFSFILIGIIILWCFFSLIWTINLNESLLKILRLSTTVFLGCGVVIGMQRINVVMSRRIINALVYGVFIAIFTVAVRCAWILINVDPKIDLGGFDPLSVLNPGLTLLAIFVWPVAITLVMKRRWKSLAGLFISYVGVLVFAGSGAAILALVAGAITVGAAMLWLKAAAYIVAALMFVATISAPFVVPRPTANFELTEAMSPLPNSTQHRLYIWEFVAENALKRPFLGWGFHSSRFIPHGQYRPPIGMAYLPLHPHNAPLQIWLELGIPGAFLFAILSALVVIQSIGTQALKKMSVHAATLGSIAAFAAVAFTAYGLWQSWWVAAGWMTTVILLTLRRSVSE
ncbi:MAG: O-antigen ligase family protein [Pseudomonadota bacterium]|nr:O-antigen ligase family protein [Pseudomonadota bacterium]